MLRKQYHFRHSQEGLVAWDVHRLIELARQLPVIEIPLSQIKELDEKYWYEHEGDTPTCRSVAEHARLIAEVDTQYPVILFSDGRVADGMHRICRLWLDGKRTVKAVHFSKDPEPDFVNIDPESLSYE